MEQRFEDLRDLLSREWARMRIHQLPAAVENGRKRQDVEPVSETLRPGGSPFITQQDWIIDRRLFQEFLDGFRLVYGDTDKLDAFIAQLRLQPDELRHLLPTGRTPGRPEVEYDDFTFPLGDIVRMSIKIPECHPLRKHRISRGGRFAAQPALDENAQKKSGQRE